MADELKPGSRWQSVTCTTQVVVVRPPGSAVELCCGGAAMVAVDDERIEVPIDPAFAAGTLLGKRYVDADAAIEVLCVNAGEGSLSIDGRTLTTKDAKPLPSSD